MVPDSSPPPSSLRLPRVFGRYILFDFIGRGAMAELYLARETVDVDATHLYLVKQVLAEYAQQPDVAETLLHEAGLASQLSHSNVVSVFELGREGNHVFIATEYVEGFDLNSLLRRCARQRVPLPLELAIYIVMSALRALDYAHRRPDRTGRLLGIVHRDISPPNLLVSFEGEVKVCDFGIARANAVARRDGSADDPTLAKIAYMSPEQARGEVLDPRADVFATGIVLWELLAGRRLYRAAQGTPRAALVEMVQQAEIPPLPTRGIPHEAALHAIVARALMADRGARFSTASAMLRELEAYAAAAGRVANSLKLATWLKQHFGSDIVQQQRMRERAAAAASGSSAPPPMPVSAERPPSLKPPSVPISAERPAQLRPPSLPIPAERNSSLRPPSVPARPVAPVELESPFGPLPPRKTDADTTAEMQALDSSALESAPASGEIEVATQIVEPAIDEDALTGTVAAVQLPKIVERAPEPADLASTLQLPPPGARAMALPSLATTMPLPSLATNVPLPGSAADLASTMPLPVPATPAPAFMPPPPPPPPGAALPPPHAAIPRSVFTAPTTPLAFNPGSIPDDAHPSSPPFPFKHSATPPPAEPSEDELPTRVGRIIAPVPGTGFAPDKEIFVSGHTRTGLGPSPMDDDDDLPDEPAAPPPDLDDVTRRREGEDDEDVDDDGGDSHPSFPKLWSAPPRDGDVDGESPPSEEHGNAIPSATLPLPLTSPHPPPANAPMAFDAGSPASLDAMSRDITPSAAAMPPTVLSDEDLPTGRSRSAGYWALFILVVLLAAGAFAVRRFNIL